MCPDCRHPVAQCQCAAQARAAARAAGDGIARVRREVSGRGGKTVTTVRGMALDDAALQALGKRLKAACGSGGTVKDGVIEIQGDHVERLMAALQREGHTARKAGG